LAIALNGIIVIFVVSSERVRDRIGSMMNARREFDEAASSTSTKAEPSSSLESGAAGP